MGLFREMGIGDLWVWFIFLVIFSKVQILNSQTPICNSNDLKALQGFFKGIDSGLEIWGSSSSNSNTSLSSVSNCCNLTGVSCDSSSSRVIGLEIRNKRLRGTIVESLADLDQLKTLNLSQNYLKGIVPSKLFLLQKLEFLDLSFNQLSGSIPMEIHLPSIIIFDISSNSFSGPIDSGICENSTQIQVLNLAMNYLKGKFPPGFGNCSSLKQLDLNSNLFSGYLPDDLFTLQNLSRLNLQDNLFSGLLSDKIGNLSNLVQLDISLNNFSGNLPNVFDKFRKLKRLSAHSNMLVGHIPTSLSNSPTIELLSLRNNSLNGSIDLNCSSMVSLTSLDLGSNKFNGPLPDSLSTCRGLTMVNLARNNLKSEIPESFKNLHSLSYLSLSNSSLHNITSALSVLQKCKNLTTLVLTLNFKSEEMPVDSSLVFTNLKALVIANCGLTGSVPQWLMSSTNLQLLDISWNQLSGTIPNWIGQMESLFFLDLSNNSFSGEIPKGLTKLQSLINRNLSLLDSSLDFPLFMKTNRSARGLQYNQIKSFPPSLDLSHNMLSGPIWPEFGNLKKLHLFDLKWNRLEGPIPAELSGMTSLETLDLSHNNLTGAIPSSLTELSFLSKFSVAYNQLVGKVPSGGQFLTFPSSSFENNRGLCYDHSNSCSPNFKSSPVLTEKARKSKSGIIGMAVAIGSGTVFLLIIIVLVVMKIHNRTRVDLEESSDDFIDKETDTLGSRSVILFQNTEIIKELSIEDLLKSTNNFDQANIIGCGGFGLVYKAILPDGRKVAIKRLSGDCGQMDREFNAEVDTLSRAQHENLVLLQGYCRCKSDKLLIYSFMENGSLDYWLHEKLDGASSLDWDTRLRIAQGAARGLAYLHQSCQPHILHRDVKSSNILLDGNFEAHLADFGLARLIRPYDTHVSTDLVGTLGYIPPEYGLAAVATFKGDVYSFGVVLLELITGKRPMDMCKPKGSRDLISWVRQMRTEKRETEVFDPCIYDKDRYEEMLLVLEIACLCLSECPKLRPSTQQIVSWLDNINLDTTK